jgi:hypothetical protein
MELKTVFLKHVFIDFFIGGELVQAIHVASIRRIINGYRLLDLLVGQEDARLDVVFFEQQKIISALTF